MNNVVDTELMIYKIDYKVERHEAKPSYVTKYLLVIAWAKTNTFSNKLINYLTLPIVANRFLTATGKLNVVTASNYTGLIMHFYVLTMAAVMGCFCSIKKQYSVYTTMMFINTTSLRGDDAFFSVFIYLIQYKHTP